MTTTTDSTRTYSGMDPHRRPCQSHVVTLQAQDQAGTTAANILSGFRRLRTGDQGLIAAPGPC